MGYLLGVRFFSLDEHLGNSGAQTFATFALLGQQHYYNSMLFRKGVRDFLIGLIFGVLFVIVDIESPPVEQDAEDKQNDHDDPEKDQKKGNVKEDKDDQDD